MKFILPFLICALSYTAIAQTSPVWQWAQADATITSGNTNYMKNVVAVCKNRLLSGEMQYTKVAFSTGAMGVYKFRLFDTANNVLDSTLIQGSVSLFDVQADSSGNWYVLGQCYDTAKFANGLQRTVPLYNSPSYFICRLNGTTLAIDWFKFIGVDYYSTCNNFFVQNSSIFLPVDSSLTTTIYKMDAATGNQSVVTSQYHGGRISSVIADAMGNLYVAGSCASVGATFGGHPETFATSYPVYIIRYKNTGRYDWGIFMNDVTCTARQLIYADNNTIFYSGTVNDSFTMQGIKLNKPWSFGTYYIVANLDSTGVVRWIRQPKDTTASRTTTDINNAVLGSDTTIVIATQGVNYADWGNGLTHVYGNQHTTVLVAYKMDGTTKWLKYIDADNVLTQHTVTNGKDIWITGTVRDSASINADAVSTPLPYLKTTPFVAKLSMPPVIKVIDTTTSINKTREHMINVYPNPANDNIVITGLQYFQNTVFVKMTDVCGKEFYSEQLPAGSTGKYINVGQFPRGVYILELRSNTGIETRKILLQ
ncbi:MAG: T9SS type A sorting domain-containing protein [Bacteroidetes bacterium]|nr:T9SS type A sorting domain-containing protein [Bacteroidota bacterium]